MKKIGIVVAIEIDSVAEKYGKPLKSFVKHGYKVDVYNKIGNELYFVDSGAGEISAGTSTQFLISEIGVDMIFNFGVVGAVSEEMKTAELCVVEKTIHYDFVSTGWLNLKCGQYPNCDGQYFYADKNLLDLALKTNKSLKPVTCASADKFVNDEKDKSFLRKEYGADICEMEAAGIIITCNRNNVPCLLIKSVSDSLVGGGKEFFKELKRVSNICFETLDKIIEKI